MIITIITNRGQYVRRVRGRSHKERGQQETRVKRTPHHPLFGISSETTIVLSLTSNDSRSMVEASVSAVLRFAVLSFLHLRLIVLSGLLLSVSPLQPTPPFESHAFRLEGHAKCRATTRQLRGAVEC